MNPDTETNQKRQFQTKLITINNVIWNISNLNSSYKEVNVMNFNNQNSYYKTNPQVNENLAEVFSQNAGYTSNLNSTNTRSKRPTLIARWYRENGKMVCRWEPV